MNNNKEIKEKIGDIIKGTFPFYTSYKIKIGKDYYEIMVLYYYMGKLTSYIQKIPKRNLIVEKDLAGFKIYLTDIKKDLISYPKNETQQEFLRK